MKVVAFNGSPRKDGNTNILLEHVLKPVQEAGIDTEIVHIGGGRVKQGCTACGVCREVKNKKCVIDTDIVNECIEKMIEADGIIFGTPSYFADMTAELKALIDRAGYVTRGNGNLLRRKVGAGVIAQRRGGATSILSSMYKMYLISEMIIPGSTYWNFGLGKQKGDVLNDAEGLENMKNLGENIAWLVKLINSEKA